jgi:hypothetical protein
VIDTATLTRALASLVEPFGEAAPQPFSDKLPLAEYVRNLRVRLRFPCER